MIKIIEAVEWNFSTPRIGPACCLELTCNAQMFEFTFILWAPSLDFKPGSYLNLAQTITQTLAGGLNYTKDMKRKTFGLRIESWDVEKHTRNPAAKAISKIFLTKNAETGKNSCLENRGTFYYEVERNRSPSLERLKGSFRVKQILEPISSPSILARTRDEIVYSNNGSISVRHVWQYFRTIHSKMEMRSNISDLKFKYEYNF